MFKQLVTTTNIETKKSKADKSPVITALTVDFTGAGEEQIRALAIAQVKVRAQSEFRSQATRESNPIAIPKTHKIMVAEMSIGGSGISAEQMESVVLAQTASDAGKRAALLKQLMEQEAAFKASQKAK